jgi:hypothetical protein
MEMPRDLGLEFEAERDGVVTIRAVDAGGEGEAVGLIVGDVIDGIDGLPGVTVEEKIVELCDDSRELRATVMRIRRGGVVMAVELFAAHDGAEASVMAWMRSLPAAADAAEPARTRGGAYRAGAHRCLADLRRCANTLWPAVLSEYAEAGSAVFREFRAGGSAIRRPTRTTMRSAGFPIAARSDAAGEVSGAERCDDTECSPTSRQVGAEGAAAGRAAEREGEAYRSTAAI